MTIADKQHGRSAPSPRGAINEKALFAALDGTIEPIRVSPLYHVGLLGAAIVMVLLPIIYVLMIILAAYGWYQYLLFAPTILREVRHWSAFLVIAGPLFAGGVLVLFMIKPLFARNRHRSNPITLPQSQHVRLYTFVYKLCDMIGAPRPSRIDVDLNVNASASFREGLSGFTSGKLVLTIGLPLAKGLTLQQFAGVLAHEFGHFAQGTGMRLTYIVRVIANWFARMVYERDSWDDWLDDTASDAGHWSISLAMQLAKLMVWIARRILWLLLITGAAVCSFMLRQMEYDADRYESRIAGSAAFSATFERMMMLELAFNATMRDLDQSWRERRMCDNLPALIAWRETRIPPEVRQEFLKKFREQKTGLFASHPSTSDRVAASARSGEPGIFQTTAAATVLFDQFDTLCRDVTLRLYRSNIGNELKDQHIVSTHEIIQQSAAQEDKNKHLEEFFGGLLSPVRPIFPSRMIDPPANMDDLANRCCEARLRLSEIADKAIAANKVWREADDQRHILWQVQAFRKAGVSAQNIPLQKMGLKTSQYRANDAAIQKMLQETESTLQRHQPIMEEALELFLTRLNLAIAADALTAHHKKSDAATSDDAYLLDDETVAGSLESILTALITLHSAAPLIESNRRDYLAMQAMLSLVQPRDNSQELLAALMAQSQKLHAGLLKTHEILRGAPYPYTHSERGATISRYALEQIPGTDNPVELFKATANMLTGIFDLYVRLMGDLAKRCVDLEKTLGFEPLTLARPNQAPSA